MNTLLLALLTLPLPAADPCADVFDRTARCAAVDAEALPAPVDPVPPLAQPTEQDDVGRELASRFLAGSVTAGIFAGAAGFGALVYEMHIATLRESAAPAAELNDALLQQGIVAVSAGVLLAVTGLLAGTSAAFLVFDPTEGRAREAFRIDE